MKNIFKTVYLLPFLSLTNVVYAQDPPHITGSNGISNLVDKVLGYLFPIAGLICVIFIIQGGYMWIISAGDPARVKQAQGTLTWAILGFIFVMVILWLLQILVEFVSK